jgi:hypothetical protein
MKKLLLAFTLLLSVISFSQLTPVVLEHDFLYQAYPNKLLINLGCFDSIQVKKDDVLLPKTMLNINGVDQAGYVVFTSFSQPVKIILSAYSKGFITSVDTTNYRIKPLPNAIIVSSSISKTTGARIQVSLPAHESLSCSYTVLGGELFVKEGISFSGNIISPEMISKVKPGRKVALNLAVRNHANNHINLIEGILEIVP